MFKHHNDNEVDPIERDLAGPNDGKVAIQSKYVPKLRPGCNLGIWGHVKEQSFQYELGICDEAEIKPRVESKSPSKLDTEVGMDSKDSYIWKKEGALALKKEVVIRTQAGGLMPAKEEFPGSGFSALKFIDSDNLDSIGLTGVRSPGGDTSGKVNCCVDPKKLKKSCKGYTVGVGDTKENHQISQDLGNKNEIRKYAGQQLQGVEAGLVDVVKKDKKEHSYVRENTSTVKNQSNEEVLPNPGGDGVYLTGRLLHMLSNREAKEELTPEYPRWFASELLRPSDLAEKEPYDIGMVSEDVAWWKSKFDTDTPRSSKVCVQDTEYGKGHEDWPASDQNSDDCESVNLQEKINPKEASNQNLKRKVIRGKTSEEVDCWVEPGGSPVKTVKLQSTKENRNKDVGEQSQGVEAGSTNIESTTIKPFTSKQIVVCVPRGCRGGEKSKTEEADCCVARAEEARRKFRQQFPPDAPRNSKKTERYQDPEAPMGRSQKVEVFDEVWGGSGEARRRFGTEKFTIRKMDQKMVLASGRNGYSAGKRLQRVLVFEPRKILEKRNSRNKVLQATHHANRIKSTSHAAVFESEKAFKKMDPRANWVSRLGIVTRLNKRSKRPDYLLIEKYLFIEKKYLRPRRNKQELGKPQGCLRKERRKFKYFQLCRKECAQKRECAGKKISLINYFAQVGNVMSPLEHDTKMRRERGKKVRGKKIISGKRPVIGHPCKCAKSQEDISCKRIVSNKGNDQNQWFQDKEQSHLKKKVKKKFFRTSTSIHYTKERSVLAGSATRN